MKNQGINGGKPMNTAKKKLMFFAPITIILFAVCGYFLFNKSETNTASKKIENQWELPNDAQKELPGSTLEINDELAKHNNRLNSDSNRDFFSGLNNLNTRGKNSDNKTVSEKDSMYLKIQKQLEDLDKKNKKRESSLIVSQSSQTKPSRTKHNIASGLDKDGVKGRVGDSPTNDIDINDFFTKKAQRKEPVLNPNESTKSDVVIYAVIHNDQKIKDTERVTLRLAKPAVINNTMYKANTLIYGFTKFSKNRVNIHVNTINHLPVNLQGYDSQDGNIGIYVEGANVAGEASKEGLNDAIDDTDVSGVPLGNTVKNLFKKKNKETPVFLLNDYVILLKPTS